jgi:hypothetical protein
MERGCYPPPPPPPIKEQKALFVMFNDDICLVSPSLHFSMLQAKDPGRGIP